MNYSLSAFQEPRGVMRILQFIFAIVAFSTTSNFSVDVQTTCTSNTTSSTRTISYPFRFSENICVNKVTNKDLYIAADLSSDAQFYVATGVLSLLYCIFIIAVYTFIDELYKSKSEIPLADFMLTTVLAIFWLSGSAAWSNGTNALKGVTDATILTNTCNGCNVFTSSFSRLNISLLINILFVATCSNLLKEAKLLQQIPGGTKHGDEWVNKLVIWSIVGICVGSFQTIFLIVYFWFVRNLPDEIIGFLNFFLWASDLWFLYKETIWFQGRQANNVGSGTPTV